MMGEIQISQEKVIKDLNILRNGMSHFCVISMDPSPRNPVTSRELTPIDSSKIRE